MRKTTLAAIGLCAMAAMPTVAQQKVGVLFIGNSITAGATLENRETQAPPTVAGNALTEELGEGYAVSIANMGLSGSTTTDWLPTDKLYKKTQDRANEMLKADAKTQLVFSICLGTNDSAQDKVNGPALSNDDYAANLRTIVDSLLSQFTTARVVLHQPIWYSENTYNSACYLAEGQHRLNRYRGVVSDVVARYRAKKQTRVSLGDTQGWDAFANQTHLFTPEAGKAGTFFLHPNKRGADKLGRLWANGIKPAIRLSQPQSVTLPSGAQMLLYPSTSGKAKRAVVVCPGGGYTTLSKENEGTLIAQWMSEQGVTGFVLFYTMPQTNPDVPNRDAREAIEYARAHAAEMGGYEEVGIMGSSAGGHLASTVATHTDLVDFQILLYPVISMNPNITHRGSHDRLLGVDAPQELVDAYSNEKRVTEKTPRALIALSFDDKTVPPLTNGMAYADALARNKVKTTLICYPTGGHGWGFRDGFAYAKEWRAELLKFLMTK